jgi:excisionase family DNA binding protein
VGLTELKEIAMTIESQNSIPSRMTIGEIAQRLAIGEMAVYRMLDEKIIPAVRVGKRWVVTRKAFEKWEERCGIPVAREHVQ